LWPVVSRAGTPATEGGFMLRKAIEEAENRLESDQKIH
jgi:hypothetical protein